MYKVFQKIVRIPPRILPKPDREIQKQGLRYETKIVKALRDRGLDLEHNPWFEYDGKFCCVDIIIYELCKNRAIVIEAKLTYTPEALEKLNTLYCPLISQLTNLQTYPLVVVRNLTRNLRFSPTDFYSSLNSSPPVYQYLGRGPII